MKLIKTYAACAALIFLTACGGQRAKSEAPTNSVAAEPSAVTQESGTKAASTEPSVSETITAAAEYPELTQQMFTSVLNGINVTVAPDSVMETGTVNGRSYSLTINLSKWEKYTTPEQMVVLSRLFWQCYPRMYARYADLSGSWCGWIICTLMLIRTLCEISFLSAVI